MIWQKPWMFTHLSFGFFFALFIFIECVFTHWHLITNIRYLFFVYPQKNVFFFALFSFAIGFRFFFVSTPPPQSLQTRYSNWYCFILFWYSMRHCVRVWVCFSSIFYVYYIKYNCLHHPKPSFIMVEHLFYVKRDRENISFEFRMFHPPVWFFLCVLSLSSPRFLYSFANRNCYSIIERANRMFTNLLTFLTVVRKFIFGHQKHCDVHWIQKDLTFSFILYKFMTPKGFGRKKKTVCPNSSSTEAKL